MKGFEMKKRKVILISVVLAVGLILAGCANIKITKTTPDGTIWKAEYSRWFHQKIDGFYVAVEPNGVMHAGFKAQLSDTQFAFKLGQASVGVGGEN